MEDVEGGNKLVVDSVGEYADMAVNMALKLIKLGDRGVEDFLLRIDETTGLENRTLFNRALLEMDKEERRQMIIDWEPVSPGDPFAQTICTELGYPDSGERIGRSLIVQINTDKVVITRSGRIAKLLGREDTMGLESESVLSLAQAFVKAQSILEVAEKQGELEDFVAEWEYRDYKKAYY